MMKLPDPMAFDVLGRPVAPTAAPVLRIIGSEASEGQISAARYAFQRHLMHARLSVVPNPVEQGRLPDGAIYKIITVGSVRTMLIWPDSAFNATDDGGTGNVCLPPSEIDVAIAALSSRFIGPSQGAEVIHDERYVAFVINLTKTIIPDGGGTYTTTFTYSLAPGGSSGNFYLYERKVTRHKFFAGSEVVSYFDEIEEFSPEPLSMNRTTVSPEGNTFVWTATAAWMKFTVSKPYFRSDGIYMLDESLHIKKTDANETPYLQPVGTGVPFIYGSTGADSPVRDDGTGLLESYPYTATLTKKSEDDRVLAQSICDAHNANIQSHHPTYLALVERVDALNGERSDLLLMLEVECNSAYRSRRLAFENALDQLKQDISAWNDFVSTL